MSFLLDPRLTQGMYMGERWVSPSTYTRVQEGKKPLTVAAQAEGLDAQGNPVKVSPTWKPGNAELVKVSPAQGQKISRQNNKSPRLPWGAGDSVGVKRTRG